MTREEILAGDEAALREAIRVRTGAGPVGRRTLQGLQELTARAYEIRLDAPEPDDAQDLEPMKRDVDTGSENEVSAGDHSVDATGMIDPPAALFDSGGQSGDPELPPPAPGTIRVRVERDYWPMDGSGRILPGTERDLPEAEAKAGIKTGALEWV